LTIPVWVAIVTLSLVTDKTPDKRPDAERPSSRNMTVDLNRNGHLSRLETLTALT
jgi:hypothetical protein